MTSRDAMRPADLARTRSGGRAVTHRDGTAQHFTLEGFGPIVATAIPEPATLALAAAEGIFAGISSGGAVAAALTLSQQVKQAVIVAIICDRGDRYLSTGVFPA